MDHLISEKTRKRELFQMPSIKIRERFKKVEISGWSRMIDPEVFYGQLFQKMKEYFLAFNKTLVINFKFEYINTSSTAILYRECKKFEDFVLAEGMVLINWYYEEDDDALLEAGENLKLLLQLPLRLIMYK